MLAILGWQSFRVTLRSSTCCQSNFLSDMGSRKSHQKDQSQKGQILPDVKSSSNRSPDWPDLH